jgi:hypothetical protein
LEQVIGHKSGKKKMISDNRLDEILKNAEKLCLLSKNRPPSSVVMSARKYVKPFWLRMNSRDPGLNESKTYYYFDENYCQIEMFVPDKAENLQEYREICATFMFNLAEVLLRFSPPMLRNEINKKEYVVEFESGFAESAIRKRGFVASRAHHTLLGLEFICTKIFMPRSHFLKDKVKTLLKKYY